MGLRLPADPFLAELYNRTLFPFGICRRKASIQTLYRRRVTAVKIAAGAIEANHISTETFEAITANIDWASIDWAEIENLSTIIAEIAKAQITTANIKEANTISEYNGLLKTELMTRKRRSQPTEYREQKQNISLLLIDNLTSAMADVVHAQIEVGDFSFADIKNLLSPNAMIIYG